MTKIHELQMNHDRDDGDLKIYKRSLDQMSMGAIQDMSIYLGLKGGGPGPTQLLAGDGFAGFFGEVLSSEFITGADLCSQLNITEGTLQHSDTEWLKFASKGETIFVAKKPIRHSISWDHIYQQGAVYGTGQDISIGEQWMLDNDTNHSTRVPQDATVEIDGNTYKVRLLRGTADDPTNSYDDTDNGSIGTSDGNYNSSESENEWNNLFLPVHENSTDDSWAYPDHVPSNVPDWGVGYNDADLLTHRDHGDGAYSWCQETRDTDESSRVCRGNIAVSRLSTYASSRTNSYLGFRPALVLI